MLLFLLQFLMPEVGQSNQSPKLDLVPESFEVKRSRRFAAIE
jgi:hypothetical protein